MTRCVTQTLLSVTPDPLGSFFFFSADNPKAIYKQHYPKASSKW